MVAFTFNAQQYTPNYGGGGEQLPPGKHKVIIVDSGLEPTSSGQGQMLVFTLQVIEGQLTGRKQSDRLNIHHTNQKTVQIANEQLTAYCHVVGQYHIQQDTAELHNKPFWVEIGWQKNNEPSESKPDGGYTEVKAIYDINGNKPGKAAPQQQQQAPLVIPGQPPAGVQPQQAWQPPGQQQPMQQQPVPGVYDPTQGQPQPQQGQQPPAQAAPGGGWQPPAQAQQPPAQPQQQAGGWQPPAQQQQAAAPPQAAGWAPPR
jgi:hypothetical protein